MDEVEIKTHSNQVIDMKGQVLQSSSSLRITKPRTGERPDETGSALLQARHLYNHLEDVTAEVTKLGMDGGVSYLQDTKYRFLKVHYYAWGLFWSSLLKAMKNRDDLKTWSPSMFAHDVECAKCKGLGKIPYVVGSPVYEEAYKDSKEHAERFGDPVLTYGTEIAAFCSPCQGVGFIFDRENYQKEHGE